MIRKEIFNDPFLVYFFIFIFFSVNRTMDLSLRDALGGGGGGVPGGNPADALLKRDFVGTLEKDSYDDKVGESISKSDYRPLLDGKDTKSGEWPAAFVHRHEEEVMLLLNVILIPVGMVLSGKARVERGGGIYKSGSFG